MGTNERINYCIRKIRKGQKQYFEELFNITNKKILFYARQYLVDKQKAEDVVNEVYIKFCENIEIIDTEKNVMNWLIKVTKNMAINYNRKDKLWNCSDIDDYKERNIRVESNFEDSIIIKDCIMGLNEEEQKLFYLYYIEDRTMREIAKIIDKSKSMVFKNIKKLNAKLKNYLEEVDN
ncbi:MAG: sigma-70 family RNA polymerase sigma factor [Clostridia bacterium]|nr:sigma-70 family RNA polymerase sigma factor [Clostridia bacterium]